MIVHWNGHAGSARTGDVDELAGLAGLLALLPELFQRGDEQTVYPI